VSGPRDSTPTTGTFTKRCSSRLGIGNPVLRKQERIATGLQMSKSTVQWLVGPPPERTDAPGAHRTLGAFRRGGRFIAPGDALHAGSGEGGQSCDRQDLGEGAGAFDAEAVDGAGGGVLDVDELVGGDGRCR
jgi:hypothetical protein